MRDVWEVSDELENCRKELKSVYSKLAKKLHDLMKKGE